jgi:hypothetical protein
MLCNKPLRLSIENSQYLMMDATQFPGIKAVAMPYPYVPTNFLHKVDGNF